jgi:hypothetical protein
MEISRENWNDVDRRIRTRGVSAVVRAPRNECEYFTINCDGEQLDLRYELARELRNEGKLPAALDIKLMLWRDEWLERAAVLTARNARIYCR